MMDGHRIKWLRWAFNCSHWKPTSSEWLQANRCIQHEELQRIERFVFQAPAISSLVGRLMLRKSVQLMTNLENRAIHFARTEEGRPYLENIKEIDVNVSHHGDWVVLALENSTRTGVDVMSLDRPINITLEEYFRLMRRQFTPKEWEQIDAADRRLHEFYRFWCLKESYVKATGVGLNLDLQKISFNTAEKLSATSTVKSTQLMLSDELERYDWLFEETLLDSNHCVAVCTEVKPAHRPLAENVTGSSSEISNNNSHNDRCAPQIPEKPFTTITISDLLSMEILNPDVNGNVWTNFNNKKYSAR